MNILITNDDGIFAQGIIALAQRLKIEHNVFVVAPDTERSGAAHSITIMAPLAVKEIAFSEYSGTRAYSVSGTPADCVVLGINALIEEKIDLVLSGINLGSNIGTNIAYSGTTNAALEGLICGYPSIAVSQFVESNVDPQVFPQYFEAASDITAQIINKLDISQLKKYILNINFPAVGRNEMKGIVVCEQGINNYDTTYIKEIDVFGRTIYKMSAAKNNSSYNEDNKTDVKWVREGYVAVTPLTWKNQELNLLEDTKCKIDSLKLHF